MLVLSSDPKRARQEMQGLIFYLVTFGYIDGEFDPSERSFVKETIRRIVESRVDATVPNADAATRQNFIDTYIAHFDEVFESANKDVARLFHESVAEAEQQESFISFKLKQRCFEVFQSFTPKLQEELIATADELLMADGRAHPAELKFRHELVALLREQLPVPEPSLEFRSPIRVDELDALPHEPHTNDYFDFFEHNYANDADTCRQQTDADRELVKLARAVFAAQRQDGIGKLQGAHGVEQFRGQEPFLDGHVWVVPPRVDVKYEVTVLGDLHGCYSCFKAALMQSRFLRRVAAYQADPEHAPFPVLVLLGDYIDRGRFSLNGVLRLALHLESAYPDHVYMLRGNHEIYIQYQDKVFSAVKPAEAIEDLRPFAPPEMFQEYLALFQEMPSVLLFGRVLFVHGGIPRDGLIAKRYKDLSSLNDADMRFQMLWGEPSVVDVIPRSLQDGTVRFGYGRLQCQAFIHQMGCHTLIRGHDSIIDGFRRNYEEDGLLLITLFSAGGDGNADLPEQSHYRQIRPKALTLYSAGGYDGETRIEAWPIDYAAYNDPALNGFL